MTWPLRLIRKTAPKHKLFKTLPPTTNTVLVMCLYFLAPKANSTALTTHSYTRFIRLYYVFPVLKSPILIIQTP